MSVTLLLLPGATAEARDETTGGEAVERLVDAVEPGERMQPLRALVELAGRLGAAEHEHAENRRLVGRKPDGLVEELPVLRRPASGAAREPRPATPRQSLERLVDLALLVGDDRLAVRRLVAREPEAVQGERILIRRRPLLLEQAAEHTKLDGVCVHEESVRPVALGLVGRRSIRDAT